MRRYNYGQNFQAFNSSKMTWLTPIGFFEVAPGDTVNVPDTVSPGATSTRIAFTSPIGFLWTTGQTSLETTTMQVQDLPR